MYNLESIRKAIVESGSITASDVVALRDIVYSKGKVEQEGAEFLFKLRKELNDFGNMKEWDNFFIQAICDFVLDDERSSDAIDEKDATWLIEQMGMDGIIDDVEQRLLKKLRNGAKRFPICLQEIQKHTSFVKDFAKKIFLFLCGNTKTLRSREYGVNAVGRQKASVYQIINTFKQK